MTNRWVVETGQSLTDVMVVREADGIPILQMAVSSTNGESGLLTREQAINVAMQIVDDWNFSCDDVEPSVEFRTMLGNMKS